ncbi:hypothetical protein [Nocardia camponoti]|uniref:DUF8020 domain-containing protein n=1 Tax=Nocardia camponoti TaxID=1616106 RepID=A0A917QJ04_9NOCA|nr:hypothetical protein [Nocardia camponoti]GGK51373.1 hypothetical protein GCM10011591_23730 [Nocardia camponoti]
MMKAFSAVALLTIAAIGVSGGTSYAAPVQQFQNVDHAVAYQVSSDGAQITATLTDGTFRRNGDAIVVADRAGAEIASLPTTVTIDEGDVALGAEISSDGTKLTASPIGYWRTTSPRERSTEIGTQIGGAIGGLVGVVVGLALGIATGGFLVPLTLPVGLLVGVIGGAIIGGLAGAAIPNSDKPDRREYVATCYGSGKYRFCY